MSTIKEQLLILQLNAETTRSVKDLRDTQIRNLVSRLTEIEKLSRYVSPAFKKTRLPNPKFSRQRKIIAKSGLFDWGYYYASHPGLCNRFTHPIDHYLSGLGGPGANPNPLFDGQWYLAQNPDVARAALNPLYHYLQFGAREMRNPHPLFDARLYLRLYPDVAASGINPLVHYLKHGGLEGRRSHWLFDAAAYLASFPELHALSMTPLEHYCRYGAWLSVQPHRHFDPDFYLAANADVLVNGINPLLHFLSSSAGELRDPAPDFSLEAYWSAHPDVKASGENPLLHFASWANNPQILLNLPENAQMAPPMKEAPSCPPGVLLDVTDNAPAPTQLLQDFLYDEFGGNERSRLVRGMQHFRLPLNAEQRGDATLDDDLERLASTVAALAATIPTSDQLDVSIIVPVYNEVRFTLACLYSVLSGKSKYSFELIIADDCSSDATPDFFAHGLPNIHHVRTDQNVGFLRNCNAAAKQAKGRFLVFLNNDTYVLPDWLDQLIDPLDSEDGIIGLTGSKLIFADGRLQEAGGLVFADGSGWNYGRFDDPRKPDYNYLRDSDYVSGASIAISRAMWITLGGFDERYEMAYYEDTDLAFRVRQAGQRVVVQPLSQLIHFEGISSGTDLTTGVKRYQVVNGETFRQRWAATLTRHGVADSKNLPIHRGSLGTVLVIDARTPMPDRDSGSIDTYQYLRILKSFGYHVLFAPENLVHAGHYSAQLQRIGVQVLYAPFCESLEQILAESGQGLDYVLLYRAPLAATVFDMVRKHAPLAKIIFNTVDLHFLRMEREAELEGDAGKKLAAQRMKRTELDLIHRADATIVLSRFELDLLKGLSPNANLFEIPIVREMPVRSENGFAQRRDIVFIGGFEHLPNVDAVQWFVAAVMPCLEERGFTGQFVVVGSSMPPAIKALERPGIVMQGFVADLQGFFSEIRLSVAPLRYGAGLKGKVISSLSYGVPVVATSVAVEGGDFNHGVNVLVADNPDQMAIEIMRLYGEQELWTSLSTNAWDFCNAKFSVAVVAEKLRSLFNHISTD